MNNIDLLAYTSVILNVLIAYLYKDSKFKYFFIFLALSDVISSILWIFFNISSQTLWLPFDYLIVMSIHQKWFIRFKYPIILGLFPILVGNIFTNTLSQHFLSLLAALIIFFLFLKMFVTSMIRLSKINIFFFCIIFNQLISSLNFVAFLNDITLGMNIYFVGIISQIIIKFLLIFVRNDASFSVKANFKR